MYFRLGRAPASCASTTAARHILLPLGRPLRSKEFGSAGAPPSLLGCHSERVAILNTLSRIQDRSRHFSLGRKMPLFALGLTSCRYARGRAAHKSLAGRLHILFALSILAY